MVKNLLILRNKTSLKDSNEFFTAHNVSFYSQEISISKNIDINLAGTKADIVLVTSQNALKAVELNSQYLKDKKVYCLNKKIADQITDIDIIYQGWSNTKQLAQYLIDNEDSSQNVIHLCADNANMLFYKQLEEASFKIKPVFAYKTEFVEEFDENIVNALKSKQIKYIMIFSAASIKAMREIFKTQSLNVSDYKFIAFSERMAQNLTDVYSQNSKIDEMLDLYLELEKGKF
jgi:uroporphyrinogen-III synthase